MTATLVRDSFRLSVDSFSRDGLDLTAFASDLGWTPGFLPPYVFVEADNGDFKYVLHSQDEHRFVYRNFVGKLAVIYND